LRKIENWVLRRIFGGKGLETLHNGRPRHRQESYIRMRLREMEWNGMDWMHII
jgi:hypothetical protein